MVTSLLTEGGRQGTRVTGATGFSMETGEFYVFNAKSVIITSGYACTMWTYSTEITGNSYRWDPNDIGDGLYHGVERRRSGIRHAQGRTHKGLAPIRLAALRRGQPRRPGSRAPSWTTTAKRSLGKTRTAID